MTRNGIIILAILLAAVCGSAVIALSLTPWHAQLTGLMHPGLLAAGAAASILLVMIPLAFVAGRDMRHLEARLTALAEHEDAVQAPSPKLLRSVSHVFDQAAAVMKQEQHRLNEQQRNQQVRLRILQTERDQLKGVLQSMRDAVIVTDAFDEVITLNESAAAALSFHGDTDERQPMERLITDRRLCQLIREAREAANFADSRVVEHLIERDGQKIAYQITLSCLENHKGDVGAVVTILHDLTREREIAQMKSDFVSKASHELRTPLSSIRAYVEMLVDGEANDEASRAEFYSIIQNETGRLSRMIDNMLNISRIEAGIIQIEREAVDFATVAKRALESLGPQAHEKRITLSNKCAPVDLTVEGDADMLYQVVLNLVSNAIKYTPEGGRVSVTADSDNLTRSVVVSVSDTGLGVPPDALPRLFEKFYRIENFKRVAKGTGLGLNLCKHIVETVHHGQIGVESQLGMGSKFWFTVPMRYAGAQAA